MFAQCICVYSKNTDVYSDEKDWLVWSHAFPNKEALSTTTGQLDSEAKNCARLFVDY